MSAPPVDPADPVVGPTAVLAPCAGVVRPLSEAPDPVFAAEMVGSGVAVEPDPVRGAALAPVSGTVVKAHPHAVAIVRDDGVGVLVHLGIDTVRLRGEGFDLLVATADRVEAGSELVRWDPAGVAELGLSPWVLVCVFDTPPGAVAPPDPGAHVRAGDRLFDWPAA
ncbi:PTS sugar transporter subunit IIA [Agilicoccus flavus]|uniref:PTS sugar transporter subunit IIA n=1 Tax=Agilicoccus flavus TaxID=2775968 RepID=UPI001CF61C33|nr:PTS glucose transporter subunit IIA [Agilicoccus flavus]